MSLRRIWLELNEVSTLLKIGEKFTLPATTFHHAIEVSRFRVGDEFEGITGAEVAFTLRIVDIKKKSAQVEVIAVRDLPVPQKPQINLAFAVSKWETTETVIEKSVELGISIFCPLLTENGFVKRPREISESRFERWQRIVASATTQSARGHLMQLETPQTLDNFLETMHRNQNSACLFAYEGECPRDIRTALLELKKGNPEQIWALVGSEGGFSAAEVVKIRALDIVPATIGPQILRAETACMAIVSIIKYEMNLMR